MSESPPGFREAVRHPGDLDLVWWLLPATMAAIGFGLLPLRSWDYWWHITIGRLVDVWEAVPAENHFLYTMQPGAESFIQPWFADWMLYVLHGVAPVYGGLLARNLIVVCIVVWLTRLAIDRSQSLTAGATLVVVGVFFLAGVVELRPHLFALPLFAISLAAADAHRHGRISGWWLLPIFGAVGYAWANLHGSFPLAAVIPILFGVGALTRRIVSKPSADSLRVWLGSAMAAAAGTLLTPHGEGVWSYMATVAANPEARQTVSEWWPTYLWAPHGLGTLFWLTVLVLIAASIHRIRHASDWSPHELIVAAAFAALAATQRRSLFWWGMVFPWAAAPLIGPVWRRWLQPDRDASAEEDAAEPGRLPTIIAAVLVLGAVATQPMWQWRVNAAAAAGLHDVRREAPLKGVVPSDLPVEATHLLRQSGRPRVFHAQKYAGYILFRLTDEHPAQRVFVDNRIELPPQRIWDEFRRTSRGKEWQQTFKKYAIRAALLNRETQAGLVRAMDQSEQWHRSYARADHVLFVPRSWK